MRPALALAALVVFGSAPALAQRPAAKPSVRADSLPLLQAVRLALAERPALGAAAAARDAAEAERDRVASDWWPRLSLESGVVRFEEPMLVLPLHGFDPTTIPAFDRTLVDATLGARWTLLDGGARRARSRAAEAGLHATEAALEGTADGTIALAVAAYADVVAARGTLEAHDLRLIALDAERERVVRALAEGAAAGVELARADAARASARADRVAAASALDIAVGDLARLTGLPQDGLAERIPDRVPAVDPPAPSAQDSAGGPAVEEARWRARAARAAADAARAAWWPEIATRGAWIERGGAEDVDTFTDEWQVGLRLEWALFTGGARGAAIARADAERAVAEEQLAQTEIDREAAIQRARSAVDRALARSEALAEAVSARVEVARVERLALDVGAGVQSDWLDAEAALLDARAALLRARADVLVASVELARAIGVLDLEWLANRLREAA